MASVIRDQNITLVGTSAPSRGTRPKAVDQQRTCAEPECSTILSRYNRSEECWSHRAPRFPSVRGVPSE